MDKLIWKTFPRLSVCFYSWVEPLLEVMSWAAQRSASAEWPRWSSQFSPRSLLAWFYRCQIIRCMPNNPFRASRGHCVPRGAFCQRIPSDVSQGLLLLGIKTKGGLWCNRHKRDVGGSGKIIYHLLLRDSRHNKRRNFRPQSAARRIHTFSAARNMQSGHRGCQTRTKVFTALIDGDPRGKSARGQNVFIDTYSISSRS